MGSSLRLKEPGLIDYLLAGGAGLAKGVVAGTAQRQEREFREEQLDISKRQFMQKMGIDIAQLGQRRKEFKETQKFQKMMQELTGEQRLEQIQETAKLRAEATKGSFFDQMLDRTKKVLDIQRVQNLITSTEEGDRLARVKDARDQSRVALETRRVDLAENTADETRIFNSIDALIDYSKFVYEPDTQLWIHQQKINMDRLAGGMSDDEKAFVGLGIYTLVEAARSGNKEIAKMAKLYAKGMDDFWKERGLPAPKVDIDLGIRKFLWDKDISITGEPPTDQVQPRQVAPLDSVQRPQAQQGLENIIGQMLSKVGIAPQQQAPPATRTVVDITNWIQEFQKQKIKVLTQEHIDTFRRMGFDDEQIAQIQEGLE